MPGRKRGPKRRLLILGGTPEAARLARGAIERFGPGLEVISSLAGRTKNPAPIPGRMRSGGFGGPEGLADYLERDAVAFVIDATHPFAATISAHAGAACDAKGVPRLMLVRPPWKREATDRWIEVDTVEAAAEALKRMGRRVFLTVGAGEIAPFGALERHWFLVRLIEAPQAPLPLHRHEVIASRGPFTVAGERELLERHRIGVLVSKLSGGKATEAKIIAARALELPVVMVRRPAPAPGACVETVDEALDWLDAALGGAEGLRVS